MSKITPIGYSKRKMGRDIAIFFLVLAAILSVILVNNGMDIIYIAYLFAGTVALGIAFILTDVFFNKNNNAKVEHMEKMLKCPYVVGSIVEVKKYYRRLDGNIVDIKPGVYVKSKDSVYKIFATFINTDNDEILVESEPYVSIPQKVLKSKRVKIYYSLDNEYWIDINDIDVD